MNQYATPNFKLILCDPNRQLCEELEKHFKFPDVEVVCDLFQNTEFDCVVSAANSFGLMDGGIDGAIIDHFGLELQEKIQKAIIKEYAGEQPIGTSMIVSVEGTFPTKYVAHTPTMRVPASIDGTDNAYLAMKAMLMAVQKHNLLAHDIQNVVCCGLGTLTGGLSPQKAAQQMALAYAYFVLPRPTKLSWPYAVEISQQIASTV